MIVNRDTFINGVLGNQAISKINRLPTCANITRISKSGLLIMFMAESHKLFRPKGEIDNSIKISGTLPRSFEVVYKQYRGLRITLEI